MVASAAPAAMARAALWLYRVEYTRGGDPASPSWANACDGTPARTDAIPAAAPRDADAAPGARAPDPSGATRGLFVRGRWASDGTWSPGGYTFSCLDGVAAKCIRGWGYKPWRTLEADGHGRVPLLPLYLACVRAARADYCGDGITHTRDGTFVDMFDRYGFNVPEFYEDHRPESAFDIGGALWVRTPRWPTGEGDGDVWRFATCTRRASPAPNQRIEPLIRVRSVTYLGR